MKTAVLPDGTRVSFPDDVTPDEMDQIVNENHAAAPVAKADVPTASLSSPPEPGLRDPILDSPVGGFIRGVRDVWDGAAQLAAHTAVAATHPDTAAGQWARTRETSTDQAVKQAEQDYRQNWRGGDDPGLDVGRFAGNIVTTLPLAVAPAATVPARIGQGIIQGGALGALNPVQSPENFWSKKALQTGFGAAGGAAGAGVAEGAARAVSPSIDPAVQTLREAGVDLTPGQTLGGTARRVEEAAKSIPFLGDAIKSSERRGMEQFDIATLNRALDQAGMKLPEGTQPGYDAVATAGRMLSNRYNELLPKLGVKADQQFADELGNLDKLAQNLPPQRYQQFRNILGDTLVGRFSPNGGMTGDTLKQAESTLGRLARTYRRSDDADQQMLGNALLEAQSTLRGLVQRSNPQYADELAGINGAYAQFLRAENAAGRTGSKEGIFTPAALNSAARQMDASGRKRAFSRGEALMQDWAQAGDQVLGSKVPDSGTPLRAMTSMIIGGAVNPSIPIGMAAGAAAYSPEIQRLITMLIAKRPAGAPAVADAIRQLGPFIGGSAAPLLAPTGP